LVEHQRKSIEKAHKAGMADIATGALHNIGNILNSIKTSAHLIYKNVENPFIDKLNKANSLLLESVSDWQQFTANKDKVEKLSDYYQRVGEHLEKQRESAKYEINRLNEHIELIANVISAQQNYASAGYISEDLTIERIIEDSLAILSEMFTKYDIRVIKQIEAVPQMALQKTKLMHTLINIFKNAKDAMLTIDNDRLLTINVHQENDFVLIRVTDTGEGISDENLARIFTHGFTTKSTGHGFGLHSTANYIQEMGGQIWAESQGSGHGCTINIRIPIISKAAQDLSPD